MEKYIFLNKTADYNIIVQNDAVLSILKIFSSEATL